MVVILSNLNVQLILFPYIELSGVILINSASYLKFYNNNNKGKRHTKKLNWYEMNLTYLFKILLFT